MPSDVSVGDQELNNIVVCKSVQVDMLTDVGRRVEKTVLGDLASQSTWEDDIKIRKS